MTGNFLPSWVWDEVRPIADKIGIDVSEWCTQPDDEESEDTE